MIIWNFVRQEQQILDLLDPDPHGTPNIFLYRHIPSFFHICKLSRAVAFASVGCVGHKSNGCLVHYKSGDRKTPHVCFRSGIDTVYISKVVRVPELRKERIRWMDLKAIAANAGLKAIAVNRLKVKNVALSAEVAWNLLTLKNRFGPLRMANVVKIFPRVKEISITFGGKEDLVNGTCWRYRLVNNSWKMVLGCPNLTEWTISPCIQVNTS